jgi:hypothetical protein
VRRGCWTNGFSDSRVWEIVPIPPRYIIRSSERRAQHIVGSSTQHNSFQLGTLERPIRDPKTFGFGTFVEAPCVVTRKSLLQFRFEFLGQWVVFCFVMSCVKSETEDLYTSEPEAWASLGVWAQFFINLRKELFVGVHAVAVHETQGLQARCLVHKKRCQTICVEYESAQCQRSKLPQVWCVVRVQDLILEKFLQFCASFVLSDGWMVALLQLFERPVKNFAQLCVNATAVCRSRGGLSRKDDDRSKESPTFRGIVTDHPGNHGNALSRHHQSTAS